MHNPVMFVDPSGRAAKTKTAAPIPIEVKVKVLELLIGAGAATVLLAAQVLNIDLSVVLGLDLSILSGGVLSLRPNTRGLGHFATDVASAVAAVAATITAPGELSEQQILDMATALAAVDINRLDEYRFFEASLINNTLTIGRAMTLAGAQTHVEQTGGSVFAVSRPDAVRLTGRLGGPLRAAEIHGGGQSGYFWHLHPRKSPNSHIWFIG